MKTILTNDPSITAWGYAVITTDNVILEIGCIKTAPETKAKRIRKSDDRIRRISEINHQLIRLIRKHQVSLILSELPHGSQNANAAIMIGMVSGIMQTLADVLHIPIDWFSEQDSKKAVLDRRSASKDEMIEAIDKLYAVQWFHVGYKDEAVADALAVHYVAQQQSELLKMVAQ